MSTSFGALGLALSLAAGLPVQRGPDLSDRDIQADLTKQLKAALPQGWVVTGTETAVTPPDWHSDQPRAGFAVKGKNGTDTFTVYFLPRDWVGIRKVPNTAPRHTYWEGILTDGSVLTITSSTDREFPREFEKASPWRSTPSIANGASDEAHRVFRGRRARVDAAAVALVRKHCKTPAEFAEAAHSLIVLGVPARSVFLRAVREVDDMEKELFCGALGHFTGPDVIDALCTVLADPRIRDYTRKYAVYALRGRTGPKVLSALRAASCQITGSEALDVVLKALTVRCDTEATPDLLTAFGRTRDDGIKVQIAHALAGIRGRDALPVLERYAADCKRRSLTDPKLQWVAQWAQLAVRRFGDDGDVPGEAVRYFLLPPDQARLGQKMNLTIVVANTSGEWQFEERDPELALLVDDKRIKMPPPPPAGPVIFIGQLPQRTLGPGLLQTMTYDLSSVIKTSGSHTVQYVSGNARSAPITIKVTEPKK
jgi:hypothetical protein